MGATGSGTGNAVLIAGIVIAFPLFFGLLWTFIVFLLSRIGGWHRLAAMYLSIAPPPGESYPRQTVSMGVSRYKRTVTITIADAGLHLDLFFLFKMCHPALLIPWSDVASVEKSSFVGIPYARITLGAKANGHVMDVYGSAADPLVAAWTKRQG